MSKRFHCILNSRQVSDKLTQDLALRRHLVSFIETSFCSFFAPVKLWLMCVSLRRYACNALCWYRALSFYQAWYFPYFYRETFLGVEIYANLLIFRPLLSHLRGYCTSGPYFWRLCAFSQKIKQLRTKYPMDLVRNVPRNSKITVLLQ